MTSHINTGAVETVPGTDITFRRTGQGRQSVLFVHGFLDSHAIWDDIIASLKTPDVEFVTVDLAGMGDRADAEGPFTLDRYADEVGKVIDLLAKPTVIVGHSIGAPIAELVAAKRPDIVGLILIASVPLAGTHLPAAALEPFSQAAGSVEAVRALFEAAWRASTTSRPSAPRFGPMRSRRSRRRRTTAIPRAAGRASTAGPSCCCRARRTT